MSMLKVACEDQRLYLVESTTIASGGVNETRVLFNFCPLWDGYAKTAVFYRNMREPYYAVVNDENIALIPWEVVKDPGFMYFGVFGIKDGVNRTSEVLTIRIVPGAITAEIAPADPTPDIYIQILSDYSTIKERMVAVDQSTAASAAAAKLSADNAKQSETNALAAETHVETLVNGFDTHVGEMKTEIDNFTEECKTELDNYVNESGVATITDVRKAAPRNLLDNSDFTNPVNQRGKTSYLNGGYTVDRWRTYNTGDSVTLQNGYISKNGNLIQRIKGLDVNKQYTAAICEKDGTISVYNGNGAISGGIGGWDSKIYCNIESDSTIVFRITSNANDIKWVALYEGAFTAETLPEYQPKGYGEELAECLRYYRRSWIGDMSANGSVSFVRASVGASHPAVSWELPMRITPTVTICSWVGGANCVRDWGNGTDVTGINTTYVSPFGFSVGNLSELTPGKVYCFHYEASADL